MQCISRVRLCLRDGLFTVLIACARDRYVARSRIVQLIINSLFLVTSATGGTPDGKHDSGARLLRYFVSCFALLDALTGFHNERSDTPPNYNTPTEKKRPI